MINMRDKITIHIQPIFNTESMDINYAEVLLRPLKKENTTATILKSVKTIEDSIALDKFILENACEVLLNGGLGDTKLSVNLGKKTLEKDEIYKEIYKLVNDTGLCTEDVILELNEFTNFSSPAVITNIKGLTEDNFIVALDDYGCGNTSLQCLIDFDIKIVKFDKTFLDFDGLQDEQLRKLLCQVHRLGIETVIEGVETYEQFKKVTSTGYKNIQGYLLGTPISVTEYKEKYLKEQEEEQEE